ncbi:MAG: rhomboid family intramembrane serine protease [Dysgonomonas sp.]
MGVFRDNIQPILKRKDILIRLIVINVVIFLLLIAVNITRLFGINITESIVDYIAVPAQLDVLAVRFWTPFTYMFVHDYKDFLHILFNMLMLYWFGRIFLTYFSPKNLGSLYLLGGLAGAIIYIVTFNTIPALIDMKQIPMVGASASVMAIIFAVAFYQPNQEITLFILGRIKIIYIALLLFVLDFIGIGNLSNPGGHIAHIGGAIMGYFYAKRYIQGQDITKWVNRLVDAIANLFKSRPSRKMKVKHKKTENDYEYNQRHHNDVEEIDRILDKIKASGYTSLSADEKKRLFDASSK